MITIETVMAVNKVLAVGGLICIALLAVLIFDLYKTRYLETYIKKFTMWLIGLVVLVSVSLTLVYSEIFKIQPCGLCWLERVFLYPQLVIALVALYIKDKLAPYYIMALSTIGFLIASYHHYIQMSENSSLPCPASGGDCSARFMFEFGFVTFPLLAAIAFGFLFVVSLYLIKTSSQVMEDSLSVRD